MLKNSDGLMTDINQLRKIISEGVYEEIFSDGLTDKQLVVHWREFQKIPLDSQENRRLYNNFVDKHYTRLVKLLIG